MRVFPNVRAFIEDAAQVSASIAVERFHTFVEVTLEGIRSPIEQLFFVALAVESESACLELSVGNPKSWPLQWGKVPKGSLDVFVVPQANKDFFRIDFLLMAEHSDGIKSLAVELDGHAFHDRTAEQRSYEKARDRHLTAAGILPVHFTGSDVVRDARAVAREVLRLLGFYIP